MKNYKELMKLGRRDLEKEMAKANTYAEVVKGVYAIKEFERYN